MMYNICGETRPRAGDGFPERRSALRIAVGEKSARARVMAVMRVRRPSRIPRRRHTKSVCIQRSARSAAFWNFDFWVMLWKQIIWLLYKKRDSSYFWPKRWQLGEWIDSKTSCQGVDSLYTLTVYTHQLKTIYRVGQKKVCPRLRDSATQPRTNFFGQLCSNFK